MGEHYKPDFGLIVRRNPIFNGMWNKGQNRLCSTRNPESSRVCSTKHVKVWNKHLNYYRFLCNLRIMCSKTSAIDRAIWDIHATSGRCDAAQDVCQRWCSLGLRKLGRADYKPRVANLNIRVSPPNPDTGATPIARPSTTTLQCCVPRACNIQQPQTPTLGGRITTCR